MTSLPVLVRRSQWRRPAGRDHRFARRFWHHGAARVGIVILALLLLAFLVGPVIWSASPTALHPTQELLPPSWSHPLGTDEYGRDELARVLLGGRQALLTVVAVLGLALAVGLAVGITTGMSGPAVDALITRVNDVFLAFPSLVAALVVLAVLGPGFLPLVAAVAVTFTAFFVRMARSYALIARQRPSVVAARMAGVARWRVAVTHVLPETASKLVVLTTLFAGHVLVAVAGLSFLGFGAQPPTPTWGAMLSDAENYLGPAPWLLLAPAIALVVLVVGLNFLGVALDDSLRVESGS